MEELKGRVAVITGGARGIGFGIAKEFAKAGCDIVLVDICGRKVRGYPKYDLSSKEELDKAVEEIRKLGVKCLGICCDVTKWDEVKDMVDRVLKEFGKIDILVNNAGIITAAPVLELEEDEWDAIMEVNAKGVFLCSKAVLPHMIERGWGRIINIASIAGKSGYASLSHYCASKFAVVGFTQSLAKEVADKGITVNAICPGIVNTHMWFACLSKAWAKPGEKPEDAYKRIVKELIPQGVDQTPEDMGRLAVFLAMNPHITGQSINVDGGHQTAH